MVSFCLQGCLLMFLSAWWSPWISLGVASCWNWNNQLMNWLSPGVSDGLILSPGLSAGVPFCLVVSIDLPWSSMSLLVFCGSFSLRGSLLGSSCLAWSPGVSLMVSLGLCWGPVVSRGLHMSLLGLNCSLVSMDLPWSPWISLGLHGSPLVSKVHAGVQ